jgi:peptide/nickel transport system substrate-binding protein
MTKINWVLPKWVLWAPLLGLFLVAAACGGEDATTAPEPTQPPAEATTAPVAAPTEAPTPEVMTSDLTGQLDIAVAAFQHEALDMAFSSTTAKTYSGHMYDYLIGNLPGGELTADRGLTTSWTIGADAASLMVNLREGVKWHDGEEFNAEDVAFTMRRLGAEEATCTFCGQIRRRVDMTEIIDPHTANIVLKAPDLTFFGTVSSRDTDIVIIAEHNFDDNGDGTFTLTGDPVGTGSVKFVDRRLGETVDYEANLDYWNTDYPPTWATRRILQLAEPSVRLNALRAGEVDMVQIDSDQVPQARDLGYMINGPKGRGTYLINYLEAFRPEFITNNLEFRKALALAIDMDAVVEALFAPGTYERSATPFWTKTAVVGYVPDLDPYPYDPEEAKRLVEASGYDGTPLMLWSFVQTAWCPVCPDILELAQGYWSEIGVNTEITPTDWTGFRPNLFSEEGFSKEFAGHVSMDRAPGRPLALQNLLISWVSQENGGVIQAYHDLEGVDSMYELAGLATTVEDLDRILQQFNRDSYEDYPAIPIVQIDETWALDPDTIASWEPGDMGFGHHWETIKQVR